jgi:hypothetical protein
VAASVRRRLLGRGGSGLAREEECPSYDTIKIQSVILAYVVAEGHRSEAVRDLLDWYIWEHRGQRAETVAAFLDLIAKGMLCIHDGTVVPFRMEHVAQAAVVGYVVSERHPGETVVGLSEKLSSGLKDGSVEIAVRELVAAGLLAIHGGCVVPSNATTES